MRNLAKVWSVCTIGCLFAGGPVSSAQTNTAPGDVDIAIRIFSLDGNCASVLNTKDVQLTSAGSTVKFDLMNRFAQGARSSDLPTFALVDLSRLRAYPLTPEELFAKTALMFKYGWNVSIIDADGLQTPFAATQADLMASFSSSRKSPRSEFAAIRSLSQNAGRHVVFVFCNPSETVDRRTVGIANSVLAILYVIDPSFSPKKDTHQTDATLFQTFTGTGDAVTGSAVIEGGVYQERSEARTFQIPEPNFENAIKDAYADGRQYYELKVSGLRRAPLLNLNVRIPDRQASRYQIETQVYGSGGMLPKLMLEQK